jgi:8-oxo-dGTP diphosphatase
VSNIFGVCALLWHPSGDQNVLSISRRNEPDNIGLPGGKVDPGETPEAAIIRECREECGIEIDPADLEPVFERLDQPGETVKVSRCYLVKKWTGHPRAMEDGFKVRWVTVQELLGPTNTTFGFYNRQLFEFLGVIPHQAVQAAVPLLEESSRARRAFMMKEGIADYTNEPRMSVWVWELETTRVDDWRRPHTYTRLYLSEELAWKAAVEDIRSQYVNSGLYMQDHYLKPLDEKLKTVSCQEVVEDYQNKFGSCGFKVRLVPVRGEVARAESGV